MPPSAWVEQYGGKWAFCLQDGGTVSRSLYATKKVADTVLKLYEQGKDYLGCC